MKKIYVVEVFRANVLKPQEFRHHLKCCFLATEAQALKYIPRCAIHKTYKLHHVPRLGLRSRFMGRLQHLLRYTRNNVEYAIVKKSDFFGQLFVLS